MGTDGRGEQGRPIRVAAVQMASQNGRVADNLARATSLVEQVSKDGAQLVLLPEFMPTGYLLAEAIWDAAEAPVGPTVAWLKETSTRLGIWLGTSFLEADGEHFYNTFVLTDPHGEVSGRVRKQSPAIWEAYFFRGQPSSHSIETALGKIGVGICFDNQTAAVAAAMGRQSVDLVLMPHSYPVPTSRSGMFTAERMSRSLLEIAPLYAALLGVPVVLANKCGPWESTVPWPALVKPADSHFPGLSTIVDSDSSVKARLGNEEGVIVAEVNLVPSRKRHPTVPHYGRWVNPGPPLRAMLRLIEGIGRLRYELSPARKRKARSVARVGWSTGQASLSDGH